MTSNFIAKLQFTALCLVPFTHDLQYQVWFSIFFNQFYVFNLIFVLILILYSCLVIFNCWFQVFMYVWLQCMFASHRLLLSFFLFHDRLKNRGSRWWLWLWKHNTTLMLLSSILFFLLVWSRFCVSQGYFLHSNMVRNWYARTW